MTATSHDDAQDTPTPAPPVLPSAKIDASATPDSSAATAADAAMLAGAAPAAAARRRKPSAAALAKAAEKAERAAADSGAVVEPASPDATMSTPPSARAATVPRATVRKAAARTAPASVPPAGEAPPPESEVSAHEPTEAGLAVSEPIESEPNESEPTGADGVPGVERLAAPRPATIRVTSGTVRPLATRSAEQADSTSEVVTPDSAQAISAGPATEATTTAATPTAGGLGSSEPRGTGVAHAAASDAAHAGGSVGDGPRVRRSWRSMLRRPPVALAGAAVALVVVVGVGQLLVPSPIRADTTPVAEPVASTELVCPVTTASAALVSTISAGVAPLPSVADGVATLADLTTLASSSEPLLVKEPGGTVTRVVTTKPGPAQLARATGSFAGAFGADQLIRSGEGSSRGLAAAPCARPVTETWLIGGGSTVGRLTQVLLVNDDDRPAQVDLLVYGPNGPVPAPGGSGIVLPASSRRQVRLDSLAPNQIVTAVHVSVTSGRVGVSGLDQQSSGLIPLGMSLLPATEAGTLVVIPDIPQPVTSARLDLISPDVDTTVALQLLTPDGSLVPVGIDHIDLQAGHVTSVDIFDVLAGQPAGLVISSTAEVVAGVEVGTGGKVSGTLHEKDATAGTPPLSAPGIVVGLAGGAFKHAVTLAAPDTDTIVRLDLYVPGSAAPQWTTTVNVAGGSVGRIAVPVTTTAATSILVVTPVSGGAAYAVREVTEAGTRGPMLALAPIYPTRATTIVPPVVHIPGSSTG